MFFMGVRGNISGCKEGILSLIHGRLHSCSFMNRLCARGNSVGVAELHVLSFLLVQCHTTVDMCVYASTGTRPVTLWLQLTRTHLLGLAPLA